MIKTEEWHKSDLREIWERSKPERCRLKAINKLGPNEQKNEQTDIVTPWAPDGAKNI